MAGPQHPRYFEFFDLDAGWIVTVDRVREALTLELALAQQIRIHNAPAPITIPKNAAGHREWYRGACTTLQTELERLSDQGNLVAPLRPWVVQQLLADTHVFDWSCAALSALNQCDYLGETDEATRLATAIRNRLDAYLTFEIEIKPRVSIALWDWYSSPPRGSKG